MEFSLFSRLSTFKNPWYEPLWFQGDGLLTCSYRNSVKFLHALPNNTTFLSLHSKYFNGLVGIRLVLERADDFLQWLLHGMEFFYYYIHINVQLLTLIGISKFTASTSFLALSSRSFISDWSSITTTIFGLTFSLFSHYFATLISFLSCGGFCVWFVFT
jgi:hypothetical protein